MIQTYRYALGETAGAQEQQANNISNETEMGKYHVM